MPEPYTQYNSNGVLYYLNKKDVTLVTGGKSVAYYFSRDFRPETAIDKVPDNKVVVEISRSNLLLLKNKPN